MKKIKKKLAWVMAAIIAAGTVPSLPSAWAKTAKDLEIVCFQELPEETLYQQVAYGTRKSSLDLPRYFYAEIRETDEDAHDADDADDTGAAVTATASDASTAQTEIASNEGQKTSGLHGRQQSMEWRSR